MKCNARGKEGHTDISVCYCVHAMAAAVHHIAVTVESSSTQKCQGRRDTSEIDSSAQPFKRPTSAFLEDFNGFVCYETNEEIGLSFRKCIRAE